HRFLRPTQPRPPQPRPVRRAENRDRPPPPLCGDAGGTEPAERPRTGRLGHLAAVHRPGGPRGRLRQIRFLPGPLSSSLGAHGKGGAASPPPSAAPSPIVPAALSSSLGPLEQAAASLLPRALPQG